MDEEQFELMYRLPETKDHIPLPSAVDYLYWRCKHLGEITITLEKKNLELEQEVIRLHEKLVHLEDDLNSHIRNHN